MLRSLSCLLFVGLCFTSLGPIAAADSDKEDAIRKDRKQIEGRWRVASLIVDGNKIEAEENKELIVVNEADGKWRLLSGDELISEGTSSIDPTKKPKTIDFQVTKGEGVGNKYKGIYQLGEKSRKICFAGPSEERPTKFAAPSGSKHVCAKYKRVKKK